ncbi:MAG TPA: hypothetical protein VEY10_03750 [Flavisolibacter sp.]|jgi:hypothetical protein|nr:hypothetical protein [Flavisolibacter sp.]
MKKILAIFIYFIFASINVLKAQSCPGVTVQPYVVNETSSVTYWGVRVTLATENQESNVTVSGIIRDVENRTIAQPFTVVVPSGYLTAQTDGSILSTGLARDVEVEVNSVTPCVTSNETPLQAVNRIGQLHNDYQEYLLSYITSQNLNLSDTIGLKQVIESKNSEFFQSNSVDISNQTFSINFNYNIGNNVIGFSASNYSAAGGTILNDLKTLIVNYDETNDASFFASLNTLQQQALSLSNQTEVYTVGIPVTIAIYSFNYWKANAQRWSDLFAEQDSIRNSSNPIAFNYGSGDNNSFAFDENYGGSNQSATNIVEKVNTKKMFKKCKVGFGQLGAADVGGAIGGAIGGAVLGPGGSLAIGVLSSSTSSLGNLAGQVMGCLFSWW